MGNETSQQYMGAKVMNAQYIDEVDREPNWSGISDEQMQRLAQNAINEAMEIALNGVGRERSPYSGRLPKSQINATLGFAAECLRELWNRRNPSN
jgi:hypothetical protein